MWFFKCVAVILINPFKAKGALGDTFTAIFILCKCQFYTFHIYAGICIQVVTAVDCGLQLWESANGPI